jgi:uncharacterized protein (TIGR03435 family)
MDAARMCALVIAAGACCYAQKFEVVSVRESPWRPGAAARGERGAGQGCPTVMKVDQGRVDIRCATMNMLIGWAYRHPPERIKGPEWMTAGVPRFDVAATIPAGVAAGQVPEMLQSMLAERFRLALRRGTVNGPIYALIVSKSGLTMKKAALGASDEVRRVENGDPLRPHWEADSITLEKLAALLDEAAPTPVPIVDMTDRQGAYQLALEVSLHDLGGPEEMESSVLRAFNDGLRKLGLLLERRHGAVPTLIVDRLQKTPTEN